MNKKNLSIISALLCGLFINPVCAATLDRIVAIVNDSVITQQQITSQIELVKRQLEETHAKIPSNKEMQQLALDHLIDIELQKQLAKAAHIEISDEALDHAIADIATKNGLSVDQLRDRLQNEGITYTKYRNDIRDQMIFSELQRHELVSSITITDQEINDVLSAQRNLGKTISAYHLQDILFEVPEVSTTDQMADAKKQAEQLVANLRKDSNAITPMIAAQTNDLGWRDLASLPSLFAPLVKNMQVGDVAGPVQAGNGFHVIKLLEVHGDDGHHSTVQIHARHILIKTNAIASDAQAQERLLDLRHKIENGVSFETLAEINSQDPVSAAKGGDLGWASIETLDPQFVNAANQLKPNQLSQPFKTQFGWHLMQLLGKRQVDDSQEYLRSQAKEVIFKKKAEEAIHNWLRQLRAQAYVKIVDDSKPDIDPKNKKSIT